MTKCKVVECKKKDWFDGFCEEHYPYEKDIRKIIRRNREKYKKLRKKIAELCEILGITTTELEREEVDKY